MAQDITIVKHATAGVSKLLATHYGAHIYNITLTTAADNGNIIKKGAWLDFDNYAEDAANAVDFKIVGQAANGNFYVEVQEDMGWDALLVYNVPMVPDEKYDETTFYNAAGDVVRAHTLCKGDIFEVSAEAFTGTPDAGKIIKTITNKKMVISA